VLIETRHGYLALEFKSSKNWRATGNSGFRRLRDELPKVRCIGVFTGSHKQVGEGYEVWPYADFLAALWDGKIIR
jgi:hypothetical protein